jgi:hypothetical protein
MRKEQTEKVGSSVETVTKQKWYLNENVLEMFYLICYRS